MSDRPTASALQEARIRLRSALTALILALRTDPLDWPAANALTTDVEHAYAAALPGEERLPGVLERLRTHLIGHEPFDQAAAAAELQRLHDAVPAGPA